MAGARPATTAGDNAAADGRTGDRTDDRAAAVFRDTARATFAFLKGTRRLDDLLAKSIPVGDGLGYLIPVCELHADDAATIAAFADWRRLHAEAFPTQFPVTVEGTTGWLRRRLLDVPERMLFLVADRLGRPVGHLGFLADPAAGTALEVDNVMRGVAGAGPGLMGAALGALLEWGRQTFGPVPVYLRVFADNARAVAFYRRHGFVDDGLTPLARHENGPAVSYEPAKPGEPVAKQFLRMAHAPRRAHDPAETILTAGPAISAREASYALDATRYGWNRQWSGYVKRFEAEFGQYVGTKYTLATSSCTGALHLALLAAGVGAGDEVIVPDITWVATANAVAYTGATPVFADVEAGSWCLDPDSVERLIGPRTKAILPVHLYGHPARMDRIMELAKRHSLRVVEDAAPSIGAEFQGRRTGSFGDFSAFSFQGAKLLVTGEGGMLCTNDEGLYLKALSLWDQGRDLNRMFWINETGWKYKMSNVQAAIGLGQLEHVDQMIEAKRRIFGWYAEGLDGVPGVTLNHEEPWARSIYWMSSILVDPSARLTRDGLRDALKRGNVDTRPVFPAISQYPIWSRPQPPQPTAKRIGDHGINLPSGVLLRREQVEHVCRCVREALG